MLSFSFESQHFSCITFYGDEIMNFYDLEVFVQIVDTGSITKTAEKLFTSQQNISRIIKKLEKDLGATLFARSKKGIELTSFGQEAFKFAKNIISERNKLILQLKSTDSDNTDKITLFMPPLFDAVFFDERFNLFVTLHPKTEFELFTLPISSIFAQLSVVPKSIGIVSFFVNPEFRKAYTMSQEITLHYLFRDNFIVIVNVNSPLANKKVLSLKELAPYSFCCFQAYGQDDYSSSYIMQKFFSVFNTITSNSLEIVLNSIAANNAFSLIPHSVYQKYIYNRFSNIIALPIIENMTCDICLAVNKSSSFDSIQQEFINLLLQYNIN